MTATTTTETSPDSRARCGDLVLTETRRSSTYVGGSVQVRYEYRLGRVVRATRTGWVRTVAHDQDEWDRRRGDAVASTCLHIPSASHYERASSVLRSWTLPGLTAETPGVTLGATWTDIDEARVTLRALLGSTTATTTEEAR